MKYIILFSILLLSDIAHAQVITTWAGNGTTINSGDGGSALAAGLSSPVDGVFDNEGNYYFGTTYTGCKVRKITTGGIISTFAGTGTSGYFGDGGPATLAKFRSTTVVAIDRHGDFYVADVYDNRIRKIDKATNIITTVVGNGTAGFSGDGGPASAAQIYGPHDVCFDGIGNMYIADYGNVRVRKVDTFGIITTVAGTGTLIYGGDGGRADTTRIQPPTGVCTDAAGNLYISDWYSRVMKVDAAGIITTFAGGPTPSSGIDGVAATATSTIPYGIRFDREGNLYISEYDAEKVRMVNSAGIISTVAGTGVAAFTGDGGPATAAQLNHPAGVAFDSCNNLYIADVRNYRIRKVTFHPLCGVADTPSLSMPQPAAAMHSEPYVYPMPAGNEVYVAGLGAAVTYNIYNAVGVIVLNGILQQGDNRIVVKDLPGGMYILELKDTAGRKTMRRIVK